jgi:predicted peptidase
MPFEIRLLESASELPYALFGPAGEPPGDGRPLLVFLHGTGERGESVRTLGELLVHSLPFLAASDRLPEAVAGAPFPFIVACPQIGGGAWVDYADRVIGLVDELCERGGADPARCCLTGVSLGGGGCWDLAASAPGRFAAIVPMSGPVRISAETATTPPAWVFHGTDDQRVPAAQAQKALAAHPDRPLTQAKFEPGGHRGEVWDRFYSRPELYEWILAQRAQVSSG